MELTETLVAIQDNLEEINSQTNSLLWYANTTTGESDIKLGDAVKRLVEGYGDSSEPIKITKDDIGDIVLTGTVSQSADGDIVVDGDEMSSLELIATHTTMVNIGQDTNIRNITVNTTAAQNILPLQSGFIDFTFDELIDLEEYDIFTVSTSSLEYKYIGDTPNAAMLESRQVALTQIHRTPYDNNGVEALHGRQFPNNNYTACSYYKNAKGDFANTTSVAYGVGIGTFAPYTITTKNTLDTSSVVRDIRYRYLASFAFNRPKLDARASTSVCSLEAFEKMDYDNMNVVMQINVYKVKRGKSINSAMLDNLWYRTPLPS